MTRTLLLFALGICAVLRADPPDFSRYNPGYNNRFLFEAVIRDLIARYGVDTSSAYKSNNETDGRQIRISETFFDEHTADKTPQEREVLIRFVLAHEYFHIVLKHPQTERIHTTPKGFRIFGTQKEARKVMERQADYLAAKYLLALGLPLEPVEAFFRAQKDDFFHPDYPSREDRLEAVALARHPELALDLFKNSILDCTTLFSAVAPKL